MSEMDGFFIRDSLLYGLYFAGLHIALLALICVYVTKVQPNNLGNF